MGRGSLASSRGISAAMSTSISEAELMKQFAKSEEKPVQTDATAAPQDAADPSKVVHMNPHKGYSDYELAKIVGGQRLEAVDEAIRMLPHSERGYRINEMYVRFGATGDPALFEKICEELQYYIGYKI